MCPETAILPASTPLAITPVKAYVSGNGSEGMIVMTSTMRDNPDNSTRATIRDIARFAGVSVATVSRVINDRPDVSDETRARGHARRARPQLLDEPQRPRALGRPHRPRRADDPVRARRLLHLDPLGRDGGAARGGPARRALSDAASPRPRGDADGAPDARYDRRRHPRAPLRIARRAPRAGDEGIPVRDRRLATAARRRSARRLRGAPRGRKSGDRPPPRASATAASRSSPGRAAGSPPRSA